MELKQKINWKNIGKEKLILFGLAGILFIGASYFESVGDSKKTEEIYLCFFKRNYLINIALGR